MSLTHMQKSQTFTQQTAFINNFSNGYFPINPTNAGNIELNQSLKKLNKKRRTVSFSRDVDIINVDSWKKYNFDVLDRGGCMAWDEKKLKEQKEQHEKELALKKQQKEEGCQCIIS